MDFIEELAGYVSKYAPDYGIKVYSPIIAQGILESGLGKSNKVYKDGEWRHNYFGLKWRNGRCAVSNEYFTEITSEQKADGTYIQKKADFFKFRSMEDCVIGYFQWTNTKAYANLKGVTDPYVYLSNIKADGYASSINYVKNLMNVISKYHLTRFDKKGENHMRFNVHAGHNPDGKIACGAVGLIQESTQARIVKNEVIRILRLYGHEVNDCTVDDGKNQSDVLNKIVAKCNSNTVDLDISIHFNSGAKDPYGNGKSTGTEVYVYDKASATANQYAQSIVNSIASLGFKNRGVKVNPSLYYLKNTKAQALLIECCFVDDADDVALYNAEYMAVAIASGIVSLAGGQLHETVVENPVNIPANEETPTGNSDALYRVQVGAFKNIQNAEKLRDDLVAMGVKAYITQ